MSFFNKVFASVGIGAAKVDTKLEKDRVMPGEEIRGIVEIRGGSVEQNIDDIYLSLHTTYIKESDERKYTATAQIDRFRLTQSFLIKENETKEIPFTFRLPLEIPLTMGRTKVWVTTGLDIKNAVDPGDKDYLTVVPNPLMQGIFNAVSNLGFRLREAECEQAPRHLRRNLPFVQEFEFVAASGPFRGRLDELELVLYPNSENEAEVLMQVDRRARGIGGFLSEAMGMDETYVRMNIHVSDLPSIQQKLQDTIARYC
ncbi:sporulation protein [Mesobacillus sp. AQ2]|jgi:sporulation-control protein|uniref:sporulation protein n=1 Tax=unclassified Mesobacillus TaxID=2675270 RepID=UPI002041D781|nr:MULTISPECIES: sporulation protein [unclassified Mesobacillus]MCM3122054.1 sporulation protein [Mesobacillus sp. MER 33]MCM3232018.1 sporulation protein [Mesobacillus sp. MER 48]WHX38975.1 sporulation protein [Mesobacillus sp. AQ2]